MNIEILKTIDISTLREELQNKIKEVLEGKGDVKELKKFVKMGDYPALAKIYTKLNKEQKDELTSLMK